MTPTPVSWSAQWIASAVCGGPRTTAPAPYLRKSFLLPSAPKQALLHITALGLYDAEINGHSVGDSVLSPGWTHYDIRIAYQTYDVTGLLKPGENILGAILGDGWYCGHVAEKNRQLYGDRPRLLAQLEITREDGSTLTIGSDDTWKTTTGPILENDLLMGESYDARLELGPWSTPGYSDTHWQPVVIESAPSATLMPQTAPTVKRHERIRMDKPLPNPPGLSNPRFDLGQNITGRVKITVKGPRGITLALRFAEVLNPNGTLYTENLRGAKATDYYTLKGEGTEVWEPRFTFHGFRYVEISWYGKSDQVAIESVEGIVLHSDTPRTGTFSCSHPLLNQLAQNILWGQKGNFLEVPTDCPQRDERLGWTGDAQVFIRTAGFFMDVHGFFRKWFLDMRDAQEPGGEIPAIIPQTGSFSLPGDGGPAWADAVFICPWTLYLMYGDKEILHDHYDCMARYMAYLGKEKVLDGIRSHPDKDAWGGFGDWLALDGSGKTTGGTPHDLIGTAHYANNADIMARTAGVLGKKEDESRWRELHTRIVQAFRNRYVTPDGLIAAGTQTAYVLALHFHLVPENIRPATARQLVRLLEKNDWHLGTGFVGTPYLLHVLEVTGHLDVAYKILEQETFPSWLVPVKHGATTIWERWDGWTPDKGFQDKGMNSFNHYAYGAVGDWMVSTVAGLEIAEPGYRKILFKPRPGGSLTQASAKLQTRFGTASIAWEMKNNQLHLDLEIPPGTSAELSLPGGWQGDKTGPLSPGRHTIEATRREIKALST
jgi:alpha-L-rhamnosidase